MYFLNLYFHTSSKTRLNAKTGHSLFAPLAQFPLLKGLTQLKSHPGQTGYNFYVLCHLAQFVWFHSAFWHWLVFVVKHFVTSFPFRSAM